MNELIEIMAKDMNINPYSNENEQSYIFRVLLSALGKWCLCVSASSQNGITGTSKHNQTNALNELVNKYIELFPCVTDSLLSEDGNLPVLIRRVYEETGYLLTDNENRNHICNIKKSVGLGESTLNFLPLAKYDFNGLGMLGTEKGSSISWREFLIRDNLTPEQFLHSKYDEITFDEFDMNIEELQFFNPLAHTTPSQSWSHNLFTEYTVARKNPIGPFYLIQCRDGSLLYKLEEQSAANDMLTGYEYRRLYFALKQFYSNPVKMYIQKLDNIYSRISFSAHLPNREYYLLLLISWPERCAWNKTQFIIKSSLLSFISEVMLNLGVKIIGG